MALLIFVLDWHPGGDRLLHHPATRPVTENAPVDLPHRANGGCPGLPLPAGIGSRLWRCTAGPGRL